MTPARWRGLAVAGLLVAAAWATVPLGARQPAPPVDFTQDIRPLLSDRCFRCHGPDANTRKAKLRLDTRDGLLKALDDDRAVVVPGDPDRSELVRRIRLAADDDDVMPPVEAHHPLTTSQQRLIERWVREGATFRDHWSWAPAADPSVPVLPGTQGSSHPIDAFVRARASREGLTWSRPAAPGTLVRRLAFTLTGLPPTAAEIEAFEAAPTDVAYARLIDRYLTSPAYGERMAIDWLDLARYADTHGYQADVTRDMSPYRDWVIAAFNRNLSYDRFLTWQLAGDLLPSPTREQRIATAFNRLHRQTNEGGSIEAEFRTEYVADRVNTFGTAMLGLTLECARCHDHKFDPITQRDYFSLFAFFNSIDESGLYSHFTNATPTPTMLLWPPHEEASHAAVQRRIEATEAALRRLARTASPAFETWRQTATVTRPRPLADLAFDVVERDVTPGRDGAIGGTLHDAPVIEAEADASGGRALRFSGDNAVTLPDLRRFTRTDAFSIVVRLKLAEHPTRAVVLHQSQAWSDAGSRGFELVLDDGRPFFGVIHFWPGNAVAVRARQPLPVGTWTSVALTYDGSSRAAGLRIYVDGAPAEVDVVRDRLTKDITYDAAQGDLQTKPPPFTIGARFRDSGLRGGLVDDLQVYDRALTALEVRGVTPAEATRDEALAHYLAQVHPASVATAAALQRLRREENRRVWRVPELMVMEELPTPRPAHLLARGAYDAPRDVVERDTPASLPPFPADQPRNRLGLARWLTSREHPLTARVVVNRIWKMHFGRGLVATVEDFGSQGRLPSHPELLDWLASRFVESGWDVKALHRSILTSATWRQASSATEDQRQRDPDNQWLTRGPALRLPAEHIRDAALAASGLLTRRIGGPSVKPYQPEGLWEQSGTGKTYQQDHGAALYRRSLYTFWRRTSPPPSLTTFDAVSREVCVARREVTSTPLQALVLLNDPQLVEAARVLAQRLVRQRPSQPAARHAAAFLALIGRRPSAEEAGVLAETYREQRALFAADPTRAAALLRVGEAPSDPLADPLDVAATTQVAALIMNLDAFVEVR